MKNLIASTCIAVSFSCVSVWVSIYAIFPSFSDIASVTIEVTESYRKLLQVDLMISHVEMGLQENKNNILISQPDFRFVRARQLQAAMIKVAERNILKHRVQRRLNRESSLMNKPRNAGVDVTLFLELQISSGDSKPFSVAKTALSRVIEDTNSEIKTSYFDSLSLLEKKVASKEAFQDPLAQGEEFAAERVEVANLPSFFNVRVIELLGVNKIVIGSTGGLLSLLFWPIFFSQRIRRWVLVKIKKRKVS